jgi:hypothetical protein
MLNVDFLIQIRRKALRRGVWFRSLDSVERGILRLVTRIVDRVGSPLLGVVLTKILRKLNDAMKSEFERKMEDFGFARARVIALLAESWGNLAAKNWRYDSGFVKHLTNQVLCNPSVGLGK